MLESDFQQFPVLAVPEGGCGWLVPLLKAALCLSLWALCGTMVLLV